MFILFIDDATRYITLYLLRNKSDATAAFVDFDRKLFNMTGRHVSVLHSDGAKEYFTKSIKEYCSLNGITQDCSSPYNPEENGRAERPNRTILEGMSAMLFDSKLPWQFWGYAAQTFVYLKNRSPHRAIPQSTPYTEWFKKIPNLSHVRVFGTRCHMYIASEKRNGAGSKLLSKTKPMILVGYSNQHKSYKLFDEERMIEEISPHVVFEKETFTERKTIYPETFINSFDANFGSSTVPAQPKQSVVPPERIEQPETNDPDEIDIIEPNSNTTTGESSQNQNSETEDVLEEDNDLSEDELISYFVNPKLPEPFALYMFNLNVHSDTPTYEEAMNGPYKKQFQAAIDKEYRSLEEHKVFSEPCQLPKGKIALDTKMVLKLKEAASDLIERIFKARLCGKGFRQLFGVDYFITYAPVATFNSLRIFITVCVSIDYEIDNIDIKTAFLHAPLEEEIYIKIPDGYPVKKGQENMVLRLLKNLYGLKQAPYAWNKEIDEFLKSLGFKQLQSDRCIYIGNWKGETIYLLIFVDDIIIGTPNRTTMAEVKKRINDRFQIEDNGPITFFLNMHFIRDWKTRTMNTPRSENPQSLY
jgi:hypothetical protein